MNEITLGSCAPDVLLSHLALYGLAAILQDGGVTGIRASWSPGGDTRPQVSAPRLTGEEAAEVIRAHAGRAAHAQSWLHRSVTIAGGSRALMSPRLSVLGSGEAWRSLQKDRHQVLDGLTAIPQYLDLRFLAALGEPCYWARDRQGVIQQDSAASRLEMQPRNRGSEFVGNRLRSVAAAVAARTPGQILDGLSGRVVRDETGRDAADSRTATGLAAPGPADNALAWCALWGISQFPLAMRAHGTAATSGHLGRSRSEWFYVPVWHDPWRPARIRTVLASAQLRIAASDGLDRSGRPLPEGGGRTSTPMCGPGEVTAARRWLAERAVAGLIRFPIERFGSDSAPERRAMRGTPLPVGSA